MDKLIETYRRRILKAALLRHQRKTGSNCLVIKLNKGGINTVELTEILLDGLLRKFERLAISEYGNVEGVKAIKGIYSSAVDVNGSGEFLTDSGKELIDELISELVEFVKKQKVEAPKTIMKWLLTAIRIPEWVHLKAAHVLSQFRARIHPCRMIGTGNLSLKVNHRWRLLSRDGGKNWEVMSHETYNREKDR
jgi:hypothetical protein